MRRAYSPILSVMLPVVLGLIILMRMMLLFYLITAGSCLQTRHPILAGNRTGPTLNCDVL